VRVGVGGVGVAFSTAGDVTSGRDSRTPGDSSARRSVVRSVRVAVAAGSVAVAAGVHGAVLSLVRGDGVGAAGLVHGRFDYSGFANAYGADFGARLRLVSLPGCVLSTPSLPACQVRRDLGSVNTGSGWVSADVAAAGAVGSGVTVGRWMILK
jgi:hypothetical protein